MAKRSKKRILIRKTRPVDLSGGDPVEPTPADYFEPEAEPVERAPTPREIVAEELSRRREEIARSMAEAQAEVTAAVERAALDLQSLSTREVAVSSESAWAPDPAIETAAEAFAEAMHGATRAVEAAGKAVKASEDFLSAEAAAADRALVEAMRAADRSVADSVRAADEAVAAAVRGIGDAAGE